MQSQYGGESRPVDRRSCRISFVSAGGDGHVVESLEEHYDVDPVPSYVDALSPIDDDVDCLVVDSETFRAIDGDGAVSIPSVPTVVFSSVADPKLAQTIARCDRCDLVYRDTAGVPPSGTRSDLDRLHDRIEAACCPPDEGASPARKRGALSDTVLETAGLLMSAAPDEVDTKIEWGLGSIAEALDADRSVVYDHEGDRLVLTHEWHASGLDPLDHETTRAATFPGFEGSLSRFEPFRTGEEPRSEGTRESLSRLGYGAEGVFVAVPVVIDWTLQRILVVDGVSPDVLFEATESRLETAGELIGRTLRRNHRRREIERQNEHLEWFASVISHDLQNPLNVITGYADLARKSGDLEHVDRIAAAAGRMENILKDLRTLTREAKDLGELEPVAVATVAERALRGVDTEDITVDIGDIGTVEADPSRLRQAFENLFRNAVEHAGTGATVRIEPIDGGFAMVDDGPGFDPEDRGRVFEEGYTGGGGTGLGLAIVRTVIDAHGWTIEATDAETGGARFEIRGIRFRADSS